MEKRISTLAVASVALRQWMGHHLWQWRDPLRIWVCLSGSCRRRRRASSSSNSIFKKAMPLFRNATQPLGRREKLSRGAQAACLPACLYIISSSSSLWHPQRAHSSHRRICDEYVASFISLNSFIPNWYASCRDPTRPDKLSSSSIGLCCSFVVNGWVGVHFARVQRQKHRLLCKNEVSRQFGRAVEFPRSSSIPESHKFNRR